MAVGLEVGFYWYQIGTGSLLHSFCSTIAVHLEGERWGTRFPALMNELYAGKLELARIPTAQAELSQVAKELAEYSPGDVVWDFEDRSAQPPWGTNISPSITSLANYFVTSDGENLVDVINRALKEAREVNKPVTVGTL